MVARFSRSMIGKSDGRKSDRCSSNISSAVFPLRYRRLPGPKLPAKKCTMTGPPGGEFASHWPRRTASRSRWHFGCPKAKARFHCCLPLLGFISVTGVRMRWSVATLSACSRAWTVTTERPTTRATTASGRPYARNIPGPPGRRSASRVGWPVAASIIFWVINPSPKSVPTKSQSSGFRVTANRR